MKTVGKFQVNKHCQFYGHEARFNFHYSECNIFPVQTHSLYTVLNLCSNKDDNGNKKVLANLVLFRVRCICWEPCICWWPWNMLETKLDKAFILLLIQKKMYLVSEQCQYFIELTSMTVYIAIWRLLPSP